MKRGIPSFGDRRTGRIGLLGGSFNPAHAGHLHISLEALKRLGLDEVWWLVSPQNPLKPTAGMAPLAARLDHARALARHPRIVVTAVEQRLGTTRTAATLRTLRRRFPRLGFVWLMGADNLAQIGRWWRWPEVFATARVAVLDRSPYSYGALAQVAAKAFGHARRGERRLWTGSLPAWTYLPIRRHAASATALRAAGRDPTTLRAAALLPPKSAKETAIQAAQSALPSLDEIMTVSLESLDNDKAQDTLTIDLTGKTSIADRMIVASGTSGRMVSAMAEHLVTKLKAMGLKPRTEGAQYGDWVLIDAGDVIVHLFRPEVRVFYGLERLWTSAMPDGSKIGSKPAKGKPGRRPGAPKKGEAKKAAKKKTAPRKPAAAKRAPKRT